MLGSDDEFVFKSHTQALSNKTLTSAVLTTPQINDSSSDHQYVFASSELTANRTVTLPLLGSDDEFVFKSHTQTLTNKTLTSPTLITPVLGKPSSGDLSDIPRGNFPTLNQDTTGNAHTATTATTATKIPSGTPNPTTLYQAGQIFYDNSNIYICTQNGTPGTWKKASLSDYTPT